MAVELVEHSILFAIITLAWAYWIRRRTALLPAEPGSAIGVTAVMAPGAFAESITVWLVASGVLAADGYHVLTWLDTTRARTSRGPGAAILLVAAACFRSGVG